MILNSAQQDKELLLLARFEAKENKTKVRDMLIKGKEELLKNKILIDRFLARRLHAITQYKNQIDVLDMPMRFISYLNKPENSDLFQKYLGKIKHDRIIKSKNNELQIIWREAKNVPPLKKEEPKTSQPPSQRSGFVSRRFQKPEEIIKYDIATEGRPLAKGVKNGIFEEDYDQKRSLYNKQGTIKKLATERASENRRKILQNKEKHIFHYEFIENEQTDQLYKQRSIKHWSNLKDDAGQERGKYDGRAYMGQTKIKDKLNPRQRQILTSLVRILILEEEAPFYERRKSLYLEQASAVEYIKRESKNGNEKLRDMMKRNILLAQNDN